MQRKHVTFAMGYTIAQTAILLLTFFFCVSPLHQQKIEPTFLWPAAIALLCLLWYTQYHRKPFPWDFLCLSVFVGWVYVTCALNKDPYLEVNRHFMLAVVLGFGGAYPAFRLFGPKDRQRWLNRFAALVVALLSVAGAACIYCGMNMIHLPSPFCQDVLGIKYGRLYLFTLYPTEAACLFTLGLVLALYLLSASTAWWRKLLWGACAACMGVCVSFTVSRTAMACVSVGLGLFAFLLVYRALGKQKLWLRAAAALLALGLVAYGCLSLMLSATTALAKTPADATPTVAADQAAAVEPSVAEDEAAATIQPTATVKPFFTPDGALLEKRYLTYDMGTLTGRTELWKAALQTIRERPVTLLIGMSDAEVSLLPQRSIGHNTYHMHNVWVETLLLTGLPGLLLYLLMAFTLARASIRLFFAQDVPFALNVLAILPPVAMLNGLMEIYPSYAGKPMDLIFFLVAGAVIAFDQDRQAARKPASALPAKAVEKH